MNNFIFIPNDKLGKDEQRPKFRRLKSNSEIKQKSHGKGFTCPYCGAKRHFNPYVYTEDFRDKHAGDLVDESLFGKCLNASCKAGQGEEGIAPTFFNGYRYSMAGSPQIQNITTKEKNNSTIYPNVWTKEKNKTSKKFESNFEQILDKNNPSLLLLTPYYETIDKSWIRSFDFSCLSPNLFSLFGNRGKENCICKGTFLGYNCELMDYLLGLGYQRSEIEKVFYEMKVSGEFYKELNDRGNILRVKGTVYWYVEKWGEVRNGKIVYSINGHRVSKKNTPFLSEKQLSLFSMAMVSGYYTRLEENKTKEFKPTVFGLKRLLEKMQECDLENIEIYIYEGEKTAVMMTLEYPSAVHLAVGGEQNFRFETLLDLFSLGCRMFVACPDKLFYDSWVLKAKEITALYSRYFANTESSKGVHIEVSDILERECYAFLPKNSDLADVIELNRREI